MKRSAINAALLAARATLTQHGFALPAWADWTADHHAANPEQSAFLIGRQIGWDATDFGTGDFARRGLTLLCIRNGIQGDASERPYAEKLLFVGENQETPFHAHKVKLEDIITRGGGNLMVEFTREGSFADDDMVRVDGRLLPAYEGPIRIAPGASITIPRGVMHRFYGEEGHGPVFVAEVSQCNDDKNDNFFLGPLGRFSTIEEDEAPLLPLWNEVAA
ncbi:MAG: D-lyxose/D-mannose family sugar isomerase [Rhodobacteraceae bacterium]|nr:D-lyxose/D-mannose family sugar isomerase [Paracoccaceae bacterium]MCF8521108.1 D-lyxose/D-mannose family sugar isomerase [Paracoccaceae bacterium]